MTRPRDPATRDPDPSDRLTITVQLFAAYQEAYGVSELVWQVPAGATVQTVLDRLLRDQPGLERWRHVTRFGVNLEFVALTTPLSPGDVVVPIPPVSGG